MIDQKREPSHQLLSKIESFLSQGIPTPTFIYDLGLIEEKAKSLEALGRTSDLQPTYSIKACALNGILRVIEPHVKGFSVSSLFEARVARTILGDLKPVHITSPIYDAQNLREISDLCNYITFNSVTQLTALGSAVGQGCRIGLRVNPGVSFLSDERYDPCRQNSKLGTPIADLAKLYEFEPSHFAGVTGLHFHTNSGSRRFDDLIKTVKELKTKLPNMLDEIQWLNMGGGYMFDDGDGAEACLSEVKELIGADIELIMEPGEYLVGESGYLASRVMDIFTSGRKQIAMLDTTINHVPECFEYQFEPDVLGMVEESQFEYILAGASCLSGDLFGEYCFDHNLKIGDLVVLSDVGAYSTVRANTFTGIPLPSVHGYDGSDFKLLATSSYSAYKQLWEQF